MFGDDYGVDYPKEIVINSGVERATSASQRRFRSTAAGRHDDDHKRCTLTGAGGAAGAAVAMLFRQM